MNILLELDTRTGNSKESRRPQGVVNVCANILASRFLYQLDFLHSGNLGTLGRAEEGSASSGCCGVKVLDGTNQHQSATHCSLHSGVFCLKSRIISANIHVLVLSNLAD